MSKDNRTNNYHEEDLERDDELDLVELTEEYDENEYDENEYDENEYDEDEYDEDEYDEDEYDEDEYGEDEYGEEDRYDNGIMLVDERSERRYSYEDPRAYRRTPSHSHTPAKKSGFDISAIGGKIKQAFASFVDWLRNLSRGKKIALAVVLAVLLLIIILFSSACSYLNRLLDGFDYAADDEPNIISFSDSPIEDEEGLLEGVSYTDVDESALLESINEVTVDENDLFYQEGTTNILLLGTDNRVVGGHARSDAIILLSVNRNTKQIIMTSFLRDTAVAFNGASYTDKLTHGYAYGKGPLMVKTIESHFGVKIDYYMAIDFFAFMDVVDYLGGINLDISESERDVMNRYVRHINRLLNLPEDSGIMTQHGKNIKVTGKQALGYARNRYSTGEGDFGRTNRQRIILTKIIEKLKADPTKALGLLEEIAPRVKTDYTKDELMDEVMNILDYVSYDIVTSRVPADDTWHYGSYAGRSLVICDFKPNQRLMIKTIYGVDMDEVLSEQDGEQ